MIGTDGSGQIQVLAHRYLILARLPRGGMAHVYRAIDQQSGDDVAIKTPFLDGENVQELRQRFQQEVQTLLGIKHDHLVAVRDSGEHQGRLFFVMDYLSGGNLARGLQKRTRPFGAAGLDFLPDVAAALDALHRHGIVHRGVKPSNILFDGQGRAFLSDLGSVDVLKQRSNATEMRAPGMAEYLAPELVPRERGQTARLPTTRSDQYSLAVVVYQVLTGQLPFQGASDLELMLKHLTEKPEPAHEVCPALPAAVSGVLDRALSKDASARFDSCTAFAEELFTALAPPEPTVPPTVATAPVSRLLPVRRGVTGPLALVLAVILAVFAPLGYLRIQHLEQCLQDVQGDLAEYQKDLARLPSPTSDRERAQGIGRLLASYSRKSEVQELQKRLARVDERTSALRPGRGDEFLSAFGPDRQPVFRLSRRGELSLFGKGGYRAVNLLAEETSGALELLHPLGKSMVRLGAAAGSGSVITYGPREKPVVDIRSDSDGMGMISTFSADGKPLVRITSDNKGGEIKACGPTGKVVVEMGTTDAGNGSINVFNGDAKSTITAGTDSDGDGVVRVSDRKGEGKVELAVIAGKGYINTMGAKGHPLVKLSWTTERGDGYVATHSPEGKELTRLTSFNDGTGGCLETFDGKGKRTSVRPGSDIAEAVAVAAGETVKPGDVVSLAGFGKGGVRVRRARSAYDSRVLGIVSGAGDIRPAVVLNSSGADNECLVALAGTVYCHADASQKPIRAGDLLVSSAVAGHVMRGDLARLKPGVVVGKALAGLPRGRGLIPVWVTGR